MRLWQVSHLWQPSRGGGEDRRRAPAYGRGGAEKGDDRLPGGSLRNPLPLAWVYVEGRASILLCNSHRVIIFMYVVVSITVYASSCHP